MISCPVELSMKKILRSVPDFSRDQGPELQCLLKVKEDLS